MNIIRKIYLYLFSTIGLVVVVIGSVQLVDLALKAWVFTKADVYLEYPQAISVPVKPGDPNYIAQPSREEMEKFNKAQLENQRQRQMANSLAMIIVGLPLYLYHWRIVRFEGVVNEKEGRKITS